MPDEEMEMAVDFGQTGFGEDIDIDLDFPAGEPDEDMDLGDFDGIHDIHNFNSDTRDELMAEGDDASYGMIDAVETDHHASASIANDIDIELEHTVESIWEQDASRLAGFNADGEIDYLDETTAENMDAEGNVETSQWLPAGTNSHEKDVVDVGVVEIFTGAQEPHEEALLEESANSREEPSEPIEASHEDAEASHSPVVSALKETEQPGHEGDVPEDKAAEAVAQVSSESSSASQDEQGVGQPNADPEFEDHGPNSKPQESNELEETSHFDEAAQTEPDNIDESFVAPDLEQLEPPEVTELNNVKEDDADLSHPEEAAESADDTSEYQLGDESYNEHTNDQAGDDIDNAPQDKPSTLNRSHSQSPEASPTRQSECHQSEVANAPGSDASASAIGVSDRDDPIELADHYGVYISYGATDYRLFAKSEDDDPNQYFLTDKSALDLSLGLFLTSLREVISEEVSPLDDLVMQVDGLGIEFSESTTLDFLGKFTFGDLVVLYDKLVKNEEAESSPPIYTYLTVRPNCIRRMMALGESANAGRGLSEVALYRDSSSMDEEVANDVGSPDTNFSNGDYDDGESDNISPQEDYEEGDTVNDDEQQNSPPAAFEAQLEHIMDQGKEADELDSDEEHNSVGNSTDAVDELDVSVSMQGICPLISQYPFSCTRGSTCPCEDCYEVELQHLATPTRAEVRPAPGTVMPTHHSPTHMTWMTNFTPTKDHATNESTVLQPQEASEHESQPSPKTTEASESKLHAPKITPTNPSTDAPNSESTSVTATLDGEEHDEIDYNPDEDDESQYEGGDGPNLQKQSSGTTPDLNALVDDEITWESDDEEAEDETKDGLAKDTVQVSPVSLKRTRSELDALDGAGDKNDNKRRRS